MTTQVSAQGVTPSPESPQISKIGALRHEVSSSAYSIALGVVVAAGCALRFRMFWEPRSFWLDPAMLALNVVEKDVAGLFGRLDWNQSASVGFLLLSKVLGHLGDNSERSLLLLPWLASVLSLTVFAAAAARYLSPYATLVAVPLLAFNRTAIYYSGEFKQYSCDEAAAVVLIAAALVVLESSHDGRRLYLFLAVTCLSAWFSYATIPAALALTISLLSYSRRTLDWRHFAFAGVALLNTVLLYLLVIEPSTPSELKTYWGGAAVPLAFWQPETWGWWSTFAHDYSKFPLGFSGRWMIPIVLALIGTIHLVLTNSRRAAIVLAPLGALVAASVVTGYPLVAGQHEIASRFLLQTVPCFCLLIGYATPALSKIFRLPQVLVTGVALLVLSSAMSPLWAWPTYLRQEMRPLVNDLLASLQPGDAIYVFHPAYPAFKFTTRGATFEGLLYGAPMPDAGSLSADLQPLRGYKRGWLVFAHDFSREAATALRTVGDFADITLNQRYPGARLIEFERRPDD